MTEDFFSRRRFMQGLGIAGAGLGLAGVLTGCGSDDDAASTSSASNGDGNAESTASSESSGSSAATLSGTITLQSYFSDEKSEAGQQALVDAYNAFGRGTVNLNTVAGATFNAQLTSYLTSAEPPDVYTWFAGASGRAFAADGLLLDISDVWTEIAPEYSPAIKQLCSTPDGKGFFAPASYQWWGVYYVKSNFEKWGVEPPETFDEFKTMLQSIQDQGVTPIGIGLSDTPWMASAWFDFFNMRVNGPQFHLDVLSGKESFTDPKVEAAFAPWKEILPYWDVNGKALAFQEALTGTLNGDTGMYLCGAFFADAAPKEALGDLDFFQFPIIDPAVPVGEEGPLDGYFASSKTKNPEVTKDFMKFLTSADAQNILLANSAGTVLPANPKATIPESPLLAKGKAMLESADQLSQFFDRDATDAVQPTADAALLKFLDNPDDLKEILADWQTAAETARQG